MHYRPSYIVTHEPSTSGHLGVSENSGYLIFGVLIMRILLFRVPYLGSDLGLPFPDRGVAGLELFGSGLEAYSGLHWKDLL